jgi:hypothetical protein
MADLHTATVYVFLRNTPVFPDTNTTSHNAEDQQYAYLQQSGNCLRRNMYKKFWIEGQAGFIVSGWEETADCVLYIVAICFGLNKPSSGLLQEMTALL